MMPVRRGEGFASDQDSRRFGYSRRPHQDFDRDTSELDDPPQRFRARMPQPVLVLLVADARNVQQARGFRLRQAVGGSPLPERLVAPRAVPFRMLHTRTMAYDSDSVKRIQQYFFERGRLSEIARIAPDFTVRNNAASHGHERG